MNKESPIYSRALVPKKSKMVAIIASIFIIFLIVAIAIKTFLL